MKQRSTSIAADTGGIHALAILAIVCCALLLAGCSSDTAADTQPAATAAPVTPTPAPVVLLPEPSAPPVAESVEPDTSATSTIGASIAFDRNGSPIHVFKHDWMPDPDGVNNEINADPDTHYFIAELRRNFIDGSGAAAFDPWFEEIFGATPDERAESLFGGGLRIFTTYDPDTQGRATQARDEVVPLAASPGDGEGTITMAAVSIDPRSGAVRALVGGPAVDQVTFNVATQSERRLGSAFDPFVLMTALEYGYVPRDTISGSGPCQSTTAPHYVVANLGDDPGQVSTLIEHTTVGSRCASLRLGELVGIPSVIETANRLGLDLDTELDNLPSLAAGIANARPVDVATAYATIANDGVYNEPYVIEHIEDPSGAWLFQHEPNPKRTLDDQTACVASEVLESAALRASGFVTQIQGQRVAGHAGITETITDVWFAGFIPELATVVWMGDPESLNATPVAGGSSLPAQAWGHIMQGYQTDIPATDPAPCEPLRPGRYMATADGG